MKGKKIHIPMPDECDECDLVYCGKQCRGNSTQLGPGDYILITLTDADAADVVIEDTGKVMNAVLYVLELQDGKPTKPDSEDDVRLYNALRTLGAVRDV